jgi:hypothetical protein
VTTTTSRRMRRYEVNALQASKGLAFVSVPMIVAAHIRMSALAVAVGEQQGWDEERNRPRTGRRGLEYCLRCVAYELRP